MTDAAPGPTPARRISNILWPILAAVLLGPAFSFTIGRTAEAWRESLMQGNVVVVVEAVGVGFGGFLIGLLFVAVPFWLRTRSGKDTKGLYYVWAVLTAVFATIGSGAFGS